MNYLHKYKDYKEYLFKYWIMSTNVHFWSIKIRFTWFWSIKICFTWFLKYLTLTNQKKIVLIWFFWAKPNNLTILICHYLTLLPFLGKLCWIICFSSFCFISFYDLNHLIFNHFDPLGETEVKDLISPKWR